MGILTIYEPTDLKKVYQVLQSHLLEHPELVDSEFLQDLQHHLQYRARRDGVDLRDHGAWNAWLTEQAKAEVPRLRLVVTE